MSNPQCKRCTASISPDEHCHLYNIRGLRNADECDVKTDEPIIKEIVDYLRKQCEDELL